MKTLQIVEEANPVDDVTLTEFCLRLSLTDKRFEMIAAFESAERSAGRVKGVETVYAARYQAFLTQPA